MMISYYVHLKTGMVCSLERIGQCFYFGSNKDNEDIIATTMQDANDYLKAHGWVKGGHSYIVQQTNEGAL